MGKFTDRKEESREVKKLLSRDYTNVRVKHGTGTAWGWIKVYFDIPRPSDCYCNDPVWAEVRKTEFGSCCRHCNNEWQRVYAKACKEVAEFTERTGDYGGRINCDIDFEALP